MTETDSDFMAMSAETDRLSEMVKAYREQDDAIRAYFGGKRDGRDTIEILKEAFHAKWSKEDTLFEAMLDHKTAELKAEIERLRAALQWVVNELYCDLTRGLTVHNDKCRCLSCAYDNARAVLAGSPPAEQPAPPSPWLPITESDPVPRDGGYFAICRAGEPDSIECGRYDPWRTFKLEEVEGGLFRKIDYIANEWSGELNNMHRATHWMPIPPPPEAGE